MSLVASCIAPPQFNRASSAGTGSNAHVLPRGYTHTRRASRLIAPTASYDPRLTQVGFWRLRVLRLIVGDRAGNPRHWHRSSCCRDGALDGCGLRVERREGGGAPDTRLFRVENGSFFAHVYMLTHLLQSPPRPRCP